MVKKLLSRLERLEGTVRTSQDNQNQSRRPGEYASSWLDNDANGKALLAEFTEHCRKTGTYGAETWVEATRSDPVAESLARRCLESYRSYVKNHFGVICDEVGSAFGQA